MPALPVIANVIACHVKGTLTNGKQWVNGYHVLKPSGMSVATAISTIDPILVALYATAHTGGGQALITSWPTTQAMAAIYYLPLDGSSATTAVSHAVAGLNTNDAMPAQTCVTVTSQTGLRGRQHRGRVFLPPVTEFQNTASGQPVATTIAFWQIQFNGFLADMTTATVFPVVASYKYASQSLITNYVVRSTWSSRRKRAPRPL